VKPTTTGVTLTESAPHSNRDLAGETHDDFCCAVKALFWRDSYWCGVLPCPLPIFAALVDLSWSDF
jgi:hypothetical protein